MPISRLQTEILTTLAAGRDPGSYVAGATPLNLRGPRYSRDIDVFHDREERVESAALGDAEALTQAGFAVRWVRQSLLIYGAEVAKGDEKTRLEWVADSDFRFFPTVRDPLFGYVLHPVDLAANKMMAAVGRREVRDILDLTTIHRNILPLGAVAWAAVEKSPGFTPAGLLAEIRRNSLYPAAEWRELLTEKPLDPGAVMAELRLALEEAEAFVARMPAAQVGLVFVEAGRPVAPDPAHLERYVSHAGRRQGHWPSSSEIGSAMLDCYRR